MNSLAQAFEKIDLTPALSSTLLALLKSHFIESVETLLIRTAIDPDFIHNIVKMSITREDWECVVHKLSTHSMPIKRDWFILLHHTPLISSGSRSIDKLLGGGFRVGGLTEIFGIASAGKTTLMLQTALHSLLAGNSVLYFGIEGFSYERLIQLQQSVLTQKQSKDSSFGDPHHAQGDLLDRLFVSGQENWKVIWNQIFGIRSFVEKQLSQNAPLRVIIIDSIAALVPSTFEATGKGEIQFHTLTLAFLERFACILQEKALKYSLAILLVNQVRSLNNLTFPAFGIPWAHHIPTRVLILRYEEENTRKVRLAYSTCLGPNECDVKITSSGIVP